MHPVDKMFFYFGLVLFFILLAFKTHAGERVEYDKQSIKHLIEVEAIRQGVSPRLAIGVAKTESSLNPAARGSKGEIGVFQVLPKTHVSTGIKDNIRAGIRELKYWQDHCPVKAKETYVICYNQGFRHPKYPLLHPYYKRVMQAMR